MMANVLVTVTIVAFGMALVKFSMCKRPDSYYHTNIKALSWYQDRIDIWWYFLNSTITL